MYGRRNNRVKFEDDNTTAPVTGVESSPSSYRYNGPRFPNLQMIFKKRYEEAPAAATVTAVPRGNVVDQSSSADQRDAVTRTRGVDDMDVNSEAADFIKRKHKNLELQKLMSTKAAVA